MSAMGEPAEAAATLRAASLEAAAMRAASLGAAVAAAKAKLEGSDQNRQHTGPSPATMAATEALAAWQERQVECSEESGSSSQQQVEEVRQKELAMLQEAVDVMKKNQDSSSSSEAAVASHIANVDAARASQDPAAVLDPVADAPPPLDPLLGVGDLTTPAPVVQVGDLRFCLPPPALAVQRISEIWRPGASMVVITTQHYGTPLLCPDGDIMKGLVNIAPSAEGGQQLVPLFWQNFEESTQMAAQAQAPPEQGNRHMPGPPELAAMGPSGRITRSSPQLPTMVEEEEEELDADSP